MRLCIFCKKSIPLKSLLPHLHKHADEAYEEEVAARLKTEKIEALIRKLSLKK